MAENLEEVIIVRIGGTSYALAADRIECIVAIDHVTPAPLSTDGVLGALNVGGAIVPLLGRGDRGTRAAIVVIDGIRFGLVVGETDGDRRGDAAPTPPPANLRGLLRDILHAADPRPAGETSAAREAKLV